MMIYPQSNDDDDAIKNNTAHTHYSQLPAPFCTWIWPGYNYDVTMLCCTARENLHAWVIRLYNCNKYLGENKIEL